MKSNTNDASETIRLQLNKIPEKDHDGNYTRFGAQLVIWFIGCAAEESSDPRTRKSGLILKRGAERSFTDYVGQKISEILQKLFGDNIGHYG